MYIDERTLVYIYIYTKFRSDHSELAGVEIVVPGPGATPGRPKRRSRANLTPSGRPKRRSRANLAPVDRPKRRSRANLASAGRPKRRSRANLASAGRRKRRSKGSKHRSIRNNTKPLQVQQNPWASKRSIPLKGSKTSANASPQRFHQTLLQLNLFKTFASAAMLRFQHNFFVDVNRREDASIYIYIYISKKEFALEASVGPPPP